MAFDPSPVTDPRIARDGDTLVISWTTTAPASMHQVYLDRRLAWRGRGTVARLPWPQGPVAVDIGTVGPGESGIDFGSTLATGSAERANLAWLGGTYLADDLAAFRVYGSTTPGGSVSYAKQLATIPAYDGGVITDGYGMGGYGQGGYGRSASSYRWTSEPLSPGVWSFAVVPTDAAGNPAASPTPATVTIAGPPNPPAFNLTGRRLSYAYNPSTRVAVLSWLASP